MINEWIWFIMSIFLAHTSYVASIFHSPSFYLGRSEREKSISQMRWIWSEEKKVWNSFIILFYPSLYDVKRSIKHVMNAEDIPGPTQDNRLNTFSLSIPELRANQEIFNLVVCRERWNMCEFLFPSCFDLCTRSISIDSRASNYLFKDKNYRKRETRYYFA